MLDSLGLFFSVVHSDRKRSKRHKLNTRSSIWTQCSSGCQWSHTDLSSTSHLCCQNRSSWFYPVRAWKSPGTENAKPLLATAALLGYSHREKDFYYLLCKLLLFHIRNISLSYPTMHCCEKPGYIMQILGKVAVTTTERLLSQNSPNSSVSPQKNTCNPDCLSDPPLKLLQIISVFPVVLWRWE